MGAAMIVQLIPQVPTRLALPVRERLDDPNLPNGRERARQIERLDALRRMRAAFFRIVGHKFSNRCQQSPP